MILLEKSTMVVKKDLTILFLISLNQEKDLEMSMQMTMLKN